MPLQDVLDEFLLKSKEEKEKYLKDWKEHVESSNKNIHLIIVGDFWCPSCKRFWMDTDPLDHDGEAERFEYIPDEDATFPEKKRHDTCPLCKKS